MSRRTASLLVLTMLASMLLLMHCRRGPADLNFTLTFKKANGLRPGQFLTYKGVRIGEVTSVDIDATGVVAVGVLVEAKYRAQVCKEATFKIEKLSMINPTGEHQVTMSVSSTTLTPVENGMIIAGTEGWIDQAIDRGKSITKTAVEGAVTAVERALGDPVQASE